MALPHMMRLEFPEEAAMAAITFNDADRRRQPLPADTGAIGRRTLQLTGAFRPRRPARTPETAMIEHKIDFQPLDPDVVSASIPAFFIGRNRAGFWVAREANGRMGGIFLFKSSAVHFANVQSRPSRCALVFPSETFELDIENRGNPLIAQLASWTDHAKRHLARLAARSQRSRAP
jgi:hypothetical protein